MSVLEWWGEEGRVNVVGESAGPKPHRVLTVLVSSLSSEADSSALSFYFWGRSSLNLLIHLNSPPSGSLRKAPFPSFKWSVILYLDGFF